MNTSALLRRIGALSALGLSIVLVGCENANNTQRGAGIGALAGAALGGIIGAQSGEAGEGAAIGAGVGALLGGGIGNERDRAEKEIESIQRQERAKQAELERERRIAAGTNLSDREVWEAEQRAKQAEEELARLRAEREAALARIERIEAAKAREAAAEAELSELRGQSGS